ncbi:MAG: N-acetylmuramoyl-L-alanine amidase [Bacteroidetes bacterium]|nr:N-acetylmuramoyl-L-alanine amidase [Bacteroidota bacterium]MBU2585391.1 N-acetylmuramoyl-L-alanine amidase [Bacteroidota bacterium]
MLRKIILPVISLFSILFIVGCSTTVVQNIYYVKPFDWHPKENQDSTISSYSMFYKGYTIFIDPGHGGTDRRNKGPKGLAIEADLNLKVGLYLRDYLQRAGANVIMSRDFDTLISLDDRSKMANESGADIFISIHHNAPGRAGDIFTNYTSTYYHATQKDYEFEPCNHDIAKYIQRDLAYSMGNSGGLGSFDGTYSDYWIYPGAGFSVLRKTIIPRVLVECAFHTSEYEEQRLIVDEFNQIQAWGIFRGLGKYLRQGIVRLASIDNLEYTTSDPQLKIFIDDQNKGIDSSFCIAQINKEPAYFIFANENNQKLLIVSPKSPLPPGEHELNAIIKNINGNHSFPFRKKFIVTN